MELLLTGFCQVFSKYNVVIHDHHWLCVMTRPSASCVTIVSVSGAVARWGGVSSIPSQDVRKVSSNILYLYNPTDLSLFDGCVIWPPPWTIFSMVSPLMVECLSSTILIEFQVWARDQGPCLPHNCHWSFNGVNVGLWMSMWMLSQEPTLELLKNIFIATNIVAKSILQWSIECKVY